MRMLIVTDGSPSAEAALRLGSYLWQTHLLEKPPTLLTVVKHEADRLQAETILARARERLGIPQALSRIRIGHETEEILREAKEGSYDLILVGEQQTRARLPRIVKGSKATRVAEYACCPVLVAKGRVGPLRRILLCDSGAPSRSILSRFMAQYARLLKGGEEVTVLHVISQISAAPGVPGKQLRASAEELIAQGAPEGQLLESDVRTLERLHIQPRPKVRHGLVVDEIVAETQGGDYDLVVIGAHPLEGWQHLLLDDLAREIITCLDRPVLVVR